MAETRELRGVLTVIDNFSKTFNDYNKKVSDATKSSKIPIYAEDKASATVKNITSKVDDLQQIANQPLHITIIDGITSRIGMISKQLDVLRAKAIIPVGMSTGLAAGGLAAGAIGVAAVGVGIAATIPAAADLEAAMIRVNKLIGMEGDAALGVQKDMQNMMMSTGKGLDQIAAAYETAGGAGIGGDKMALGDYEGARKEISDFVQITLEASSAFNMTADATSSMLSGISNVYKPIGQETNKFLRSVGSGIDAVADATIASEEKIMTAMSHASSAMAMFEQNDKTVKDTIALSAALISTNMSGDAAGEAIKDFFNYAKTDADAKISKSLGMSQAAYQEQLKVDPMAIMNAVNAKYNSMDAAAQGEYSKLFGMTGGKIPQLSGSANFQAGLTKAQGVVNPAYDSGTKVSESFAKSMAGFWTQLDKVRQTITVLAQIVGGIFLPGLNAILGVVNALIIPFVKLIQYVIELGSAIPGMNLVVTAASILAVVTAVSALMSFLGPIIAGLGLASKAMMILSMYGSIAGAAISAMAGTIGSIVAILGGPLTLIIAIVAVIGILLYKTGYLQKAWDKFKNSAIGKDLIGGIVAGVAWVTTAFSALFTWLDKQWADMSSGAGTGLLGVLGSIMGALGGMFDKIDNAYKSGDLGKMAMNIAMAIFPPLMLIKPILMIFDLIKNNVVWLLEKLVVVFEWAVTLWKRAVAFLEWLWGGMLNLVKAVTGVFEKLFGKQLTSTELKTAMIDAIKASPDIATGRMNDKQIEWLAKYGLGEAGIGAKPEGDIGITDIDLKIAKEVGDSLKNPSLASKASGAVDKILDETINAPVAKALGNDAFNLEKGTYRKRADGAYDLRLPDGTSITGTSDTNNVRSALKDVTPLATGTDYVPKTDLYLLHQGERVTPASQNRGGGAIGISVYLGGIKIDKMTSEMDLNRLGSFVEKRALNAVKSALAQRRT